MNSRSSNLIVFLVILVLVVIIAVTLTRRCDSRPEVFSSKREVSNSVAGCNNCKKKKCSCKLLKKPSTISESGCYRVCADIIGDGTNPVIVVSADNVLLDLGWHTLDGNGAPNVVVVDGRRTAMVKDGIIRNSSLSGVKLLNTEDIVLDNLELIAHSKVSLQVENSKAFVLSNSSISQGNRALYVKNCEGVKIEKSYCRNNIDTIESVVKFESSRNINAKEFHVDNNVKNVRDTSASVTGSIAPANASFTGSIALNVLTVTAVSSGTIRLGQEISGTGIPSGVLIHQFGTGTGGIGTYLIDASLTIASASITATAGLLTVTALSLGTVKIGQYVTGTGVVADTLVTAYGPSTTGGIGTYTVNYPQTIASSTLSIKGQGWNFPANVIPNFFNAFTPNVAVILFQNCRNVNMSKSSASNNKSIQAMAAIYIMGFDWATIAPVLPNDNFIFTEVQANYNSGMYGSLCGISALQSTTGQTNSMTSVGINIFRSQTSNNFLRRGQNGSSWGNIGKNKMDWVFGILYGAGGGLHIDGHEASRNLSITGESEGITIATRGGLADGVLIENSQANENGDLLLSSVSTGFLFHNTYATILSPNKNLILRNSHANSNKGFEVSIGIGSLWTGISIEGCQANGNIAGGKDAIGNNHPGGASGIYFSNGKNGTIKNCQAVGTRSEKSTAYGIVSANQFLALPSDHVATSDLIIENCYVSDTFCGNGEAVGIMLTEIERVQVSDCVIDKTSVTTGNADAITLRDVKDVIVSDCDMKKNLHRAVSVETSNPNSFTNTNVILENNKALNNGEGFIFDASSNNSNCVVQGNHALSNAGNGFAYLPASLLSTSFIGNKAQNNGTDYAITNGFINIQSVSKSTGTMTHVVAPPGVAVPTMPLGSSLANLKLIA